MAEYIGANYTTGEYRNMALMCNRTTGYVICTLVMNTLFEQVYGTCNYTKTAFQ